MIISLLIPSLKYEAQLWYQGNLLSYFNGSRSWSIFWFSLMVPTIIWMIGSDSEREEPYYVNFNTIQWIAPFAPTSDLPRTHFHPSKPLSRWRSDLLTFSETELIKFGPVWKYIFHKECGHPIGIFHVLISLLVQTHVSLSCKNPSGQIIGNG